MASKTKPMLLVMVRSSFRGSRGGVRSLGRSKGLQGPRWQFLAPTAGTFGDPVVKSERKKSSIFIWWQAVVQWKVGESRPWTGKNDAQSNYTIRLACLQLEQTILGDQIKHKPSWSLPDRLCLKLPAGGFPWRDNSQAAPSKKSSFNQQNHSSMLFCIHTPPIKHLKSLNSQMSWGCGTWKSLRSPATWPSEPLPALPALPALRHGGSWAECSAEMAWWALLVAPADVEKWEKNGCLLDMKLLFEPCFDRKNKTL